MNYFSFPGHSFNTYPMNPDSVSIVLVEPQGSLNIGSVCRVMMNFGFTDLRLVNPRADHLSKQSRDMAVSARDVLKNAKLFKTLTAALADRHYCVGSTRRFSKTRADFIEPHEISSVTTKLSPKQRLALVFGREDNGLTNAELDLCQSYITIPTNDALPSMNLAQAVAVCLYEFSRQHSVSSLNICRDFADIGKIEHMFEHMHKTLLESGYLDPKNPDHLVHTFRRIFSRAGLDYREVRILHGLWSRIDWLINKAKKRDKGTEAEVTK